MHCMHCSRLNGLNRAVARKPVNGCLEKANGLGGLLTRLCVYHFGGEISRVQVTSSVNRRAKGTPFIWARNKFLA